MPTYSKAPEARMSRIDTVARMAATLAPFGATKEEVVREAFALYDLVEAEDQKRTDEINRKLEAKRREEAKRPKLPPWAPKDEDDETDFPGRAA